MKTEEVRIINGGGWTKAIKIGVLLKILCDIGISSLPFMIVLDSDNRKEEKERELQKSGFSREEYYILAKKEIEDYLFDAIAITRITGKSVGEVNDAIKKSKGGGKEKLKHVFRILDLNALDASEEVKQLLVVNMEGVPDEISLILSKINEKLEHQ